MTTQFPDNDDGAVLKLLAEHGIIEARITFSGGGDSGAIDDIYVDHVGGLELKAIPFKGGEGDLAKYLENLGDELLERTQQDWYNNDGGGGTIYITPGTGRIYVAMYYNVTSTEDCPVDFSVDVTCDGNVVEREIPDNCGQVWE